MRVNDSRVAAIGVLSVLLIVLIAPSFACIYNSNVSVVQWWTAGRAQLEPGCAGSFGCADVVACTFEKASNAVGSIFIPLWNTLASFDLFRLAIPSLLLAIAIAALRAIWKRWMSTPISR